MLFLRPPQMQVILLLGISLLRAILDVPEILQVNGGRFSQVLVHPKSSPAPESSTPEPASASPAPAEPSHAEEDSENEVTSSLDPDEEDTDGEYVARPHSGDSEAVPRSMSEALKRDDRDLWCAAAQEEINAHLENGTWVSSPLPPGKKAIPCRWVFAKKYNADGSVERLKARLVAKGFSQRPGFDYVETFDPTVRMASVRTVLALAALEDLDLRSVDISHAYINGTLEEEIYMQQPDGFHFGKPGEVLRLVKSLYGLKQPGRIWYLGLRKVLKQEGFTCLQSGWIPCLHGIWRSQLE